MQNRRCMKLFRHHMFWFCLATTTLAAGCASDEPSAPTEDDLMRRASDSVEAELKLLDGSAADIAKLKDLLLTQETSLKQQKKEAKARAASDVASYTAEHWERSWWGPENKDLVIDARSKDLFDRPERRRLEGVSSKLAIVKSLLASSNLRDDKAFALKEQYVEIAIAIELNGELGLVNQGFARLFHMLRDRVSWLGKVFKGLRRDAPNAGKEAANIDLSGKPEELWKKDPASSSVWHRRSPEDTTPERLVEGPWYRGRGVPVLPKAGEVWKLAGLRSQMSDGTHASADISHGDASLKLKFRKSRVDVYEEIVVSRLMWAMGYETEAQYIVPHVRVEPRVFLAAHATKARIGWKFRIGKSADDIVPGRPPKGISVPFAGLDVGPEPEFVHVKFKDGHEETGTTATNSLSKAFDDRALLNKMEWIELDKAEVEAEAGERESIGPWDFDADAHINQREVRALGILMSSWLDSRDMKPSNLRLELKEENGTLTLSNLVSDTGSGGGVVYTNITPTVPINLNGKVLHANVNAYTVSAFDRMTLQDAKWAVAQLAALSVEQIRAAVSTGAFTEEAVTKVTGLLVSRRNSLVKSFGMEASFPEFVVKP